MLLSGKTVERNRNQFDLRNKKDKHSFKADSADSAGKWVISVQEALLGTVPTEPTPVEMEECESVRLVWKWIAQYSMYIP